MDRSAIRSYAVFARQALMAAARQRLYELGIGENGCISGNTECEELAEMIRLRGAESVIEEAAYTWFDRFIALRFMEVNGYLPVKIRVFSDSEGAFRPEILTEALSLPEELCDRRKVLELLEKQANEELYRYLIISLCNSLNEGLPEVFEEIGGWTELLFPANLLRSGSVAERLVTEIPEEDWHEQVQIIGWLYQYYNSEPKERVFADLQRNIKISAETLPAATQLFTPDWIVRYLVENSLGRLWLEGHPASAIKSEFAYYLDEPKQSETAKRSLDELRERSGSLLPQQIRILDPCMGSGHILTYAFDVLMLIYTSSGWSERDAARSIVENNLFGLDVDKRAYQLAYFAVMMKARQYDRRILAENVRPRLACFAGMGERDTSPLVEPIAGFVQQFQNGELLGSLMDVTIPEGVEDSAESFDGASSLTRQELKDMVSAARLLDEKYHVVVTNPPYMGHGDMSAILSEFVKKRYPLSKTDLFACFIEKCGRMTKTGGFCAMITQQAWMFLSSYQGLRRQLLDRTTVNMAHLGPRAFDEIGGEVVQPTAFVDRICQIPDYRAVYVRLTGASGEAAKEELFISEKQRYIAKKEDFTKIPGQPVAYDLPPQVIQAFDSSPALSQLAETRLGMTTADNARFTRFWFEPALERCIFSANNEEEVFAAGKKWVPYNKGGRFRKWYGNLDVVVNWENKGAEIRGFSGPNGRIRSTVPNTGYYFRECATWSKISAGTIGFRYRPPGSIFDVAGACLYSDELLWMLAFANSAVAMLILRTLSPTLNYEGSHISALPVKLDERFRAQVEQLTEENIALSRRDWDSFETSWDFQRHPLI